MIADPVSLALAAALCFGLALVVTQLGLRHMAPGQGALVSIPTSAVLLWLASPALMDWRGFAPQPAAIFAGVGLLFPATVTLLTFEANRRMGPNVAGALGNLAPLFAILVAVVLFGEAPSLWQVAGIAAVMLGIAGLSAERRWLEARWPWWAMALPLGAAAIRGLVQPVAKLGLANWPSPFAAALIGYTVSAVVIAGVALRGAQGERGFDRGGALWFGCVGVSNGCAVLALYAALARGSVTLVSPLVATYPLVTLALSMLLLRGTRLDARVAVGVMLTVTGVVILIAAR
jgi:drug/metabolite transporter (DMT)-like permease